MKDNLILLLQEHLMSKFTHHSQPQAVSDPFSTAPPPQLNAFPASGHTSQPLVASSLTAPPPQLNAFPASGHTSQPLVASSLTAPPPQLTAFPASGHISQPLVYLIYLPYAIAKYKLTQRRFRCVRIRSSHHLLKLSRMNR